MESRYAKMPEEARPEDASASADKEAAAGQPDHNSLRRLFQISHGPCVAIA